jgi:hypothetical protein
MISGRDGVTSDCTSILAVPEVTANEVGPGVWPGVSSAVHFLQALAHSRMLAIATPTSAGVVGRPSENGVGWSSDEREVTTLRTALWP